MKEVKIWSKIFLGLGFVLIIIDIVLRINSITDSLIIEYGTSESLKLTALLSILMSFAMKSFYNILEYKENKINSSEKRIKSLEDKIDKLMKN